MPGTYQGPEALKPTQLIQVCFAGPEAHCWALGGKTTVTGGFPSLLRVQTPAHGAQWSWPDPGCDK